MSLPSGTQRKAAWRRVALLTSLLILFSIAASIARGSGAKSGAFARAEPYAEWGLAVLFFLIGAWIVHSAGRVLRESGRQTGDGGRTRTWLVVSRSLTGIGYAFVAIVTLHLLRIPVSSILVGGALTGVIIGIATQSTLGNLFAGILLYAIRPFSFGERISIRSSSFSSYEYTGRVVDINWYHTVVDEGERRRALPNSAILSAVITTHPVSEKAQYTVSLPLTVPPRALAQALEEQTGGAAVTVTDFTANGYSATVTLPPEADPDLLRAALLAVTRQAEKPAPPS
jgi:small conductance mechanosensitive channel